MTQRWTWAEQRARTAYLALEDGTVLRGYSIGAKRNTFGETVFNTGLCGYQEILSDPSYAGQFVTMTYPEIGNTGMNLEDMESRGCFASGFLVHAMNEPSNWRSNSTLHEWLVRHDIPALAGIETRLLTTRLREKGILKGFICVTDDVSEVQAVKNAAAWEGLVGQDYASRVSCESAYSWDPDGTASASWGLNPHLPKTDLNIVAYDFGIKLNILRQMRQSGMKVTVVPAKTSATEVLRLKPDGVFLSNGPADPAAVTYAIDATKSLLGKVPVMGICLGHQILALALGGRTYRLKFGHHGCNHPVLNNDTGRVEITSQNHNYAVDAESINRATVEISHINLNDQTVEGIRVRNVPAFSVQYHPEAAPGPHDPAYLFSRFRELITKA